MAKEKEGKAAIAKGRGRGRKAAEKAEEALKGKRKQEVEEVEEVEEVPAEEVEDATSATPPAEQTTIRVLSKAAANCRSRIQKFIHRINETFHDLALALKEAADRGYPQEWGYDNLKTAAEAGEFGEMGWRQAYYLVECGNAIVAKGLTKEQTKDIGWSKLKEVAKQIEQAETQEEVDEYLEKARNLSSKQLQEEMREIRGTAPRPDILRITSLSWEPAESQVVSSALQNAFDTLGTDSIAAALAYICGEYIQLKGESPERTSLEAFIEYLEGQYGVTLQVVDGSVREVDGEEEDTDNVDDLDDDVLGGDGGVGVAATEDMDALFEE